MSYEMRKFCDCGRRLVPTLAIVSIDNNELSGKQLVERYCLIDCQAVPPALQSRFRNWSGFHSWAVRDCEERQRVKMDRQPGVLRRWFRSICGWIR